MSVSAAAATGRSLRSGDTLTLVATVRSTTNAVLSGVALTWSSLSPEWAAIDQSGRVTFALGKALGTRLLSFRAQAGTVAGQASVTTSDWSYSESVNPVSLATTYSASLGSIPGVGFNSPRLTISCLNAFVLVQLSSSGITESGRITYRFSGQAPVSATWNESSDFRALFAPSQPAARTFVSQIAVADTLHAEWLFFTSGLARGAWLLRGWQNAVPQVMARCP